METPHSPDSDVFRIGPEDYISRNWYPLASFLVLLFSWILVSFVLGRFVPFFRVGSYPVGSVEWFGRSFVTGAWAAMMVMWPGFSQRRRRYEIEIKSDRIIKSWNQETRNIYREEFQGVKERREFGKLQGFVVTSKYHNIFIPAGHPRYLEIKSELSDWQRGTAS